MCASARVCLRGRYRGGEQETGEGGQTRPPAWLNCGGSAAGETFDMNLTSWSGTGLGEDGFSRMLRSSLCVVWVREGGVGVPAGGERGEAARR